MLKIVTGKTGEAHVTSADARAFNAGLFGKGMYVLDTGNKLSASKTGYNTIKVRDGDLIINGTHARIGLNEDETVTINGGTSGMNRLDLIVAEYKKAGGLESVQLKVIQGTPTSGTPVEPTYYKGDILAGATTVDMPLYSVRLNGVDVQEPKKLFAIKKPLSEYFDLIYPIGSIYVNYYDKDPAEMFGGIWERFAQGRSLIGVGVGTAYGISRSFPENTYGGDYYVKLTKEEMPKHSHRIYSGKASTTFDTMGPTAVGGVTTQSSFLSTEEGEGEGHTNVHPYITVYMWKRIG